MPGLLPERVHWPRIEKDAMENSNNTLKRLEPMTLVEEANRGFVNMAEVLMRVLTWNRPFLDRPGQPAGGQPARSVSAETKPGHQPQKSKAPTIDPQKLEQLKKTVEKFVRPGQPDVVYAARASLDLKKPISSEELDRHLRCLFHQDPDIRFDAVSWLRRNFVAAAVPTLEGVLIIEEDDQVRNEIECALETLRADDNPQKGDLP